MLNLFCFFLGLSPVFFFILDFSGPGLVMGPGPIPVLILIQENVFQKNLLLEKFVL